MQILPLLIAEAANPADARFLNAGLFTFYNSISGVNK